MSRLLLPLPMITLAALRTTLTATQQPCLQHSRKLCPMATVLAGRSPTFFARRATHSSPSDPSRVASTARPSKKTVAPTARAQSSHTHEQTSTQHHIKDEQIKRSKHRPAGASDNGANKAYDLKTYTAASPRRKNSSKGPSIHSGFTKGRPKRMPDNFRPIPDTERIEGMDKAAVSVLFTKRAGTHSLSNEAFSIKASRMPFAKPPQPNIPVFVKKAQAEYDQALERYHQQQKELESISTLSPVSTSGSSSPVSSATTTKLLPMPEPSPLIRQYNLRNQRQYPSSLSDPHPAFRVTFIVSKKLISKLAVHRNFARKKLAAAVETVFRDHARPGYEYLIFAKRECVTTLQDRLIELMKSELSNPKLYGERDAGLARGKNNNDPLVARRDNKDPKATATTETDMISDKNDPEGEQATDSMLASPAIKMRWKNNNPPIYQKWWKHALPNPLGRTQQSGAYLNMYCPEAQDALAPLRLAQGRLKKKEHIRKRNARSREEKNSQS